MQSQSDQDDDNDPDGPYAFRRKKNCNYHEVCFVNIPFKKEKILFIENHMYIYLFSFLYLKCLIVYFSLVWMLWVTGHGPVRQKVDLKTRDSGSA